MGKTYPDCGQHDPDEMLKKQEKDFAFDQLFFMLQLPMNFSLYAHHFLNWDLYQ